MRKLFISFFALSGLFLTNLKAATFTVINQNDVGIGSFRQALLSANLSPGTDTIVFQIPGQGPFSIIPLTSLPPVTPEAVIIDGTTQPGFNGRPLIELIGSSAGATANGLLLLSGNCTVRGLAINRFAQSAIRMESGGGNLIEGNFIGTGPSGTNNYGNGISGINIFRSADNIIGGTNVSSRNIISGRNPVGVYIQDAAATRNQVIGNYIGTDLTGTLRLGNTNGVVLSQAPFNQVGGTSAGAGNLISGNVQSGVYLSGQGSFSNEILGNLVGTDYRGVSALSNLVDGVTVYNASSNRIGGVISGSRNIISGNSQRGVFIYNAANGNLVQGNYIGTDVTGTRMLGNGYDGVQIAASANNNAIGGTQAAARNIISANKMNGILISAPSVGTQVQNNYIGTDFTGRIALGNTNAGVWLESASNTIGALNAGNLISANKENGVYLHGPSATNNFVQGNFIGTDVTGTARLGNSFSGVTITNAPRNFIGGTQPGQRNLISASLQDSGVKIQGAVSSGNQIQGNFIGTDITGSLSLGNFLGGIFIYGSPSNTIGGLIPGAGNLVSGNPEVGISIGDPGANGNIVQGNFIGTKLDGDNSLVNKFHNIEIIDTASFNVIGPGNRIAYSQPELWDGVRVFDGCTNNSIRGNAIFSNGLADNGLGIDLGAGNPTLNDLKDTDGGANGLQNFPVLTSASGQYITTINGTLNSVPSKTFIVDFYASTGSDPSGYGEGQSWLGSKNVNTDTNGNATFTVTFTNAVPVGRVISATATDSANNTSEFSLTVVIPQGSNTDSDGDGMSDDFENANGFANNSNDAALDADGDGFSNLHEYQAGTDPRNALDALRLLVPEKSGANVLLGFDSIKDKNYRIESTTSFGGWTTLPAGANISGTGLRIQITDTNPGPTRYYRLRLL